MQISYTSVYSIYRGNIFSSAFMLLTFNGFHISAFVNINSEQFKFKFFYC